jgi:hypothetical protein
MKICKGGNIRNVVATILVQTNAMLIEFLL